MKVTLPDGTPLELPDGATGADAAARDRPGPRARRARGQVDGEVRDLARPLSPTGRWRSIITSAPATTRSTLIRHDAAHVLADRGDRALSRA